MLGNEGKHSEANQTGVLEGCSLPAVLISEHRITECNKSFAALVNSPEEELVGAALESVLARFAADDGTLRASPVVLREDSPPQVVFLKPKGEHPVCAAMAIQAENQTDGASLMATFSVIDAKVLQEQESEVFRGRTTSRLWHVAIFDHDHLSNKIYMSPLFREIYGVDTEDELTFENAGQFVHPDDVDMEAVLKAHDPAGTGLFDKAFRIIRPSGEIRWIHSRSQTLFDVVDGKRQGVRTTGAIVDFTDEYLLKQELRESKQRLADILDSLPSIVLGIDGQGRIAQWNKLAEAHSRVAEVGHEERILEEQFPMLTPRMAWIRKAMRDGESLQITRIPYGHERSTFFYNVSVIPLHNTTELDAVVRIDDITEEVRVEQTLIQSEKLLSVGGLAAGMAHEINSPLFVAIQNALFIQEKLDPEAMENRVAAARIGTSLSQVLAYLEEQEIPEMIESIREAGSRASKIVRNMLGFVRVSDGHHAPCDITDLLDTTIGLLRNDYDPRTKYSFREIGISKEYANESREAVCDSGKMQQVFLNILKNAGQAMCQAGTPTPEIAIRVYRGPKCLRIEIEDNGPGVPDEISRRIFEPFFTTKPRGEGTGLGLSISYSIVVKEHGGRMYVEPGARGGSKFVIELPETSARVSATRAS